MNAAKRIRPGDGTDSETAGRRVTQKSNSRVFFTPGGVALSVRCDLSRPSDGDHFGFEEVGRRLYRAVVGIPPAAVLQIVVSAATPVPVDPIVIPPTTRLQLVAPDGQTLARWAAALSGLEATL